jgi:hypothetical protein
MITHFVLCGYEADQGVILKQESDAVKGWGNERGKASEFEIISLLILENAELR